ncbi:MAG: CAP domain-containing protein [Acidimicrobiia bacterium]
MASFGMAVSAAADSGSEGEFLAKINATREANGLSPLQIDGGLRSHARNHTQDMIDAGEIFHSSESELRAAGGSGWERIGENVGRGQSPSSLHSAFMDSPSHRQNILGDFNYVGVGTGSSDGYLYVTVVFMKKGSTSPTTTEAPSPTTTEAPSPEPTDAASPETTEPASPRTSRSAPATTSTTTTVPPTTTTTLIVPPDKAITPGQSCIEANRYFQICHD